MARAARQAFGYTLAIGWWSGRAEVDGIARLIEGLSIAYKDDAQRIERGAAVFGNLYESLKARRS